MQHSLFKILFTTLITVLLVSCSPGEPPTKWQTYATLGLYTGSISEDGRYAVIGAQEEGGSLWEINSEERLFDWNHESKTKTLVAKTAFSPEGDFAVTANQQDLVLWHTNSGMAEWFWSSPGEILDIALTPQGQYALLGLANHTAVFFDIVNGGIKSTLRHKGRVRAVALSKDGTIAITGSDDYSTSVWDMEKGELLQQLTLDNIIDTVAITNDNKTVFSASSLDRGIIWDVDSGRVKAYISGDESLMQKRISYLAARFSEDGSRLLTGNSSGIVELWNTNNGQLLNKWKAHKKDPYGPTSVSILDVAFGQSGTYFAIGSNGLMNTFK